MRPAECLNLDWTDLDLRGNQERFKKSGGGIRYLTMPAVVLLALESLPHRTGPVLRMLRGADTSTPTFIRRSVGPGPAVAPDYRVWSGSRPEKPQQGPLIRTVRAHVPRHARAAWHFRVYTKRLRLDQGSARENQDMLKMYVKLMPKEHR